MRIEVIFQQVSAEIEELSLRTSRWPKAESGRNYAKAKWINTQSFKNR